MSGIYQRLGIRPIVNARGTHTRLGGSLMAAEVLDAMREAATAFVVLDELQAKASQVIARWRAQTEYVALALRDLPGVETRCRFDESEYLLPQLEVTFNPALGVDAHELVLALEDGDQRVFLFEPTGPNAKPNSIVVNPHPLQPGQERIVAEVLGVALRQRLAN